LSKILRVDTGTSNGVKANREGDVDLELDVVEGVVEETIFSSLSFLSLLMLLPLFNFLSPHISFQRYQREQAKQNEDIELRVLGGEGRNKGNVKEASATLHWMRNPVFVIVWRN
jgi:hypothetical protein